MTNHRMIQSGTNPSDTTCTCISSSTDGWVHEHDIGRGTRISKKQRQPKERTIRIRGCSCGIGMMGRSRSYCKNNVHRQRTAIAPAVIRAAATAATGISLSVPSRRRRLGVPRFRLLLLLKVIFRVLCPLLLVLPRTCRPCLSFCFRTAVTIDAGAASRSSSLSRYFGDTRAVSLGDESQPRPGTTAAVRGVVAPVRRRTGRHSERAASVARRGGSAGSEMTGDDSSSSLAEAARRLNEAVIRSVSSDGAGDDEQLFRRVVVEGLAADFRRRVRRRHHAASSESETRSRAGELMEAGGPMPEDDEAGNKTGRGVSAAGTLTYGIAATATATATTGGGGGGAAAVHNGLDVDVATMNHPPFVIPSALVENCDHAVAAAAATIELAAGSAAVASPSEPERCSPVVAATPPIRLPYRDSGAGVGASRTLTYRCRFSPSSSPLSYSPGAGGTLLMASPGRDIDGETRTATATGTERDGSATATTTATKAAATVRRRLRRVIDQAVTLYASPFFTVASEQTDNVDGIYADDIVRLRRAEVTELVERATLALRGLKDDYEQEDPDVLLDPVAEAARRLNEAVVLCVRSDNDEHRALQLVEELAAEYRRIRKVKEKETQAEARPSQPTGRIVLSEFDDRLDQLMTLTMTMTPPPPSSVSMAKQVESGTEQPLGTTAATTATQQSGRGPGSEGNRAEVDDYYDTITEKEDEDVVVRSRSLRNEEQGGPTKESHPRHLHPPTPPIVTMAGRVGESVISAGRSSSNDDEHGAEAPTVGTDAPVPTMAGDDGNVAPIPFYAEASVEEWVSSTMENQGVAVTDAVGVKPRMAGGRIVAEAESNHIEGAIHANNATVEEAAKDHETNGVGATAEGLEGAAKNASDPTAVAVERDGADVVAAVVTAAAVAAALATKVPVVAAGVVVAPLVSSAIQSIKASPAFQAIQGWHTLDQ